VFPLDPDDPPQTKPVKQRACPDCRASMHVGYVGEYGTIYVCPKCDIHITVPPKPSRGLT